MRNGLFVMLFFNVSENGKANYQNTNNINVNIWLKFLKAEFAMKKQTDRRTNKPAFRNLDIKSLQGSSSRSSNEKRFAMLDKNQSLSV